MSMRIEKYYSLDIKNYPTNIYHLNIHHYYLSLLSIYTLHNQKFSQQYPIAEAKIFPPDDTHWLVPHTASGSREHI
jgi:hypothetical protein